MSNEEVQTRLRAEGGGVEVLRRPVDSKAFYDPAGIAPAKKDARYCLSLRSLGRLERLAKARFIIAERRPDFDPAAPDRNDPNMARSIVTGVFASSEIEGEGVSAEYIDAFVAAQTEPSAGVNKELSTRLHAHKDIIETYWWALEQHQSPVLPYDMVLEAHQRMFHRAKPEFAGRIKEKENYIRWTRAAQTVRVPTVAAADAETFLRALCDRVNHAFTIAEDAAESPMLLTAGEFFCDFLAIHPFSDGNGRVARLLSAYLLERGGYHFTTIYPFDQVVLDSRGTYYEALNASQQNWHEAGEDLTPWVEYFVGAVFEQWERAFRRIRDAHAR